jgi:hypothetical protein
MDMIVVCSPGTVAEMDRFVAALAAVGLHPMTAYQAPKAGLFEDKPSSYPILVPKTELKQAEAIIRAVNSGVPAKDQYEPPVPTSEQAKRALAAIGLLTLVIVGLTALLLLIQFLSGLSAPHR